jgi:hypothetical protein
MRIIIFFYLALSIYSHPVIAQNQLGVFVIHPHLGELIDSIEKTNYKLFPFIKSADFISAFFKISNDSIFLVYDRKPDKRVIKYCTKAEAQSYYDQINVVTANLCASGNFNSKERMPNNLLHIYFGANGQSNADRVISFDAFSADGFQSLVPAGSWWTCRDAISGTPALKNPWPVIYFGCEGSFNKVNNIGFDMYNSGFEIKGAKGNEIKGFELTQNVIAYNFNVKYNYLLFNVTAEKIGFSLYTGIGLFCNKYTIGDSFIIWESSICERMGHGNTIIHQTAFGIMPAIRAEFLMGKYLSLFWLLKYPISEAIHIKSEDIRFNTVMADIPKQDISFSRLKLNVGIALHCFSFD